MLILPLNTLEIRSPSAPWCQQKFQGVSGEMASPSTAFYQLVIPTMEMLLMRSRQHPRTIFLEAEVRKPRAQEASVGCIWVGAVEQTHHLISLSPRASS